MLTAHVLGRLTLDVRERGVFGVSQNKTRHEDLIFHWVGKCHKTFFQRSNKTTGPQENYDNNAPRSCFFAMHTHLADAARYNTTKQTRKYL